MDRVLWARGDLECVMVSCCAGAELQLRRKARLNADTLADDIELDQLLGAAGRDLFFANEAGGSVIELLKGRKPDESLVDEG